MNYLKALIPIAGLMAVLSGCTTVNTVERAEPVNPRQMISDKRVLTDVSLNKAVRILGVNDNSSDPTATFLKVQIEVQNVTRSLKSFTYRFEWFDANGMLVTTGASPTIPKQIEGKETVFIAATAPTPTARDFRVKFLEVTR